MDYEGTHFAFLIVYPLFTFVLSVAGLFDKIFLIYWLYLWIQNFVVVVKKWNLF